MKEGGVVGAVAICVFSDLFVPLINFQGASRS